MKKIGLAVLAVLLVSSGFLYFEAKRIFTPTTGPRIARYAQPNRALLVIDVQEDYTGTKGKKAPVFPHAETQIATINRLIEYAESKGMLVAYVRQVFDNNLLMRPLVGRAIEGTPGAAIDARVHVINGNEFTKKISDAFSNPQLSDFLVSHQVDELFLVGLDAAYCVHKTALGAINRGYRVNVITDAVLTQKDLSKVLQQYDQDGITKIASQDVLTK